MNAESATTESTPPLTAATPTARRELAPLTLLVVVGALMTLSALATDAMLPAFPAMAKHFGVTEASIQSVVSVFMIGYALPHLLIGSLADRFGRRPILLGGLAVYLVGAVVAWAAPSLTALLIGRFVQGLGASAGPIMSRAVLRDLYQGRELGRMLSYAMIFFSAAPLLAPAVGTALLAVAQWRAIFVFLVLVAVVLGLLVLFVLPETLAERSPGTLKLGALIDDAKLVFGDPRSGWTVALMALAYGGLMAYLLSAPALYMGHFALNETGFALIFAGVASTTFIAQPLNVFLLRRYSPEQILRGAVPGYLVAGLLLLGQVAFGIATLPTFTVNLMAFFMSFSLTLANGTTVALDPHQRRAGMASGLMGFAQLSVGTGLGSLIAAYASHGPFPLALGLTCLGLLAFGTLRLALRSGTDRNAPGR